jgi:cellulose synthase/poly-beta-1,6-N-acetylglucosamine synthase-like glycosyltransferase
MPPHSQCRIGIVAIGRNEGERLRRCLRSIPDGTPVVYVDSASTDDSVAFAEQRGAKVLQLDVSQPFTAARARSEGLTKLLTYFRGLDYVQFVDGDCELENGWLEIAQRFLDANPKVATVCGRRRERRPEASFYNRLCDEEWNTPPGPAAACGGDALLRTSALREVGGFNPTIVAGEEPELCWRLQEAGWSIWRLDAPMTIHDADMFQFSQWWRRALRSGYGYAQVWHGTVGFDRKPLYGRELGRAVFWTVGVMSATGAATIAVGAIGLLLAPLLWIAQLARLSFVHGLPKAVHLLVGKLAEFFGAAGYFVTAARGKQRGTIFYK